jgi:hypothetical protein
LSVAIALASGSSNGDEAVNEPNSQSETQSAAVVIGIHGLLNKPPAAQLEEWWKQAIDEGLRRSANASPEYVFELAYWADVRNPKPIALADLDEPYTPAPEDISLPQYDGGPLDSFRGFLQKWGGRTLDKEKDLFGLGTNVEHLIGIKLADLDEYYQDQRIRRAMRDRLVAVLRQHESSNIVLVAHSMGSIIAYDVLRELGDDSELDVEHLITIGSPLGLPIVGKKIRQEFGNNETPAIVRRWTNVSDPGDKVALDCRLADEYDRNAAKIGVEDVFIVNGYRSPVGDANNHKSYGYLRAPEFTALLKDALVR